MASCDWEPSNYTNASQVIIGYFKKNHGLRYLICYKFQFLLLQISFWPVWLASLDSHLALHQPSKSSEGVATLSHFYVLPGTIVMDEIMMGGLTRIQCLTCVTVLQKQNCICWNDYRENWPSLKSRIKDEYTSLMSCPRDYAPTLQIGNAW